MNDYISNLETLKRKYTSIEKLIDILYINYFAEIPEDLNEHRETITTLLEVIQEKIVSSNKEFDVAFKQLFYKVKGE